MQGLSVLAPGTSPCPALAGDHLCGLMWRHEGNHVPFVPGDYLPPSLLHPLDVWLLLSAWRCPACMEKFDYSPGTELVTVFRGSCENWDRAVPEWQWTFHPCGCVGRVVPASTTKPRPMRSGLEAAGQRVTKSSRRGAPR